MISDGDTNANIKKKIVFFFLEIKNAHVWKLPNILEKVMERKWNIVNS